MATPLLNKNEEQSVRRLIERNLAKHLAYSKKRYRNLISLSPVFQRKMRPANFLSLEASLNPQEDENGIPIDYNEWVKREKSEERRRNDRRALIKKLTSGMGPQNSKIVQLNEYICKMR